VARRSQFAAPLQPFLPREIELIVRPNNLRHRKTEYRGVGREARYSGLPAFQLQREAVGPDPFTSGVFWEGESSRNYSFQHQPQNLAEMVGATRSRVSHFKNEFRTMGFIDYAGNGALTINNGLLAVILSG
jgi:hypothetical protein